MIRNRRPKKIIRKKRPINLIQLKGKDLTLFRRTQWRKQRCKCAILRKYIPFEHTTLDHKHKLKEQRPGPNGRGLIRGVLHFQANSLEGVIVKKYKRYGLDKLISLPCFLRNMADYIENPPCPQRYIHPSEEQKDILKKSDYNLIAKYYKNIFPRRSKIPCYPKSGIKRTKSGKIVYKAKMTPKWKGLLELVIKHKQTDLK